MAPTDRPQSLPRPVVITGADLRDPWHCYENQHLDVLQFHGAVSTAVALHRLGRDDLAHRFVAWAYANDTTEVMQGFADRVEAARLPTIKIEPEADLQALIAEVFAVADGLDDANT